jgi:hypothetical protein
MIAGRFLLVQPQYGIVLITPQPTLPAADMEIL